MRINESDLKPGTVFVTPTYGNKLDRFIGAGIRFFTATQDEYGRWHDAKVNHTGLYVGDGKLIEAAPGGVRLADWDSYGDDAVWAVDGMGTRQVDGSLSGPLPLTDEDRARIVAEAKKLLGTPYGFLDIVAIAFAQARMKHRIDPKKPLHDQPWWVRRIEDRHTIICSQLVDLAHRNAGIRLFADGRIPGLVSPNDIYGLYE